MRFIQDAYCMASLDNITGSDYSWSGSVGSLSFNALDRLITPCLSESVFSFPQFPPVYRSWPVISLSI
ncbi:hypothetical protein FZ929_00950 [Klebsiella pneumoniae]|uniref:Uncharacterized protein n=1 Tax=Klebsiella pneumoniae TaxID=573 RepID=A0A5C2LGF7_KLEPN|nr:hypothetical protein FZ929_00950 [Klebsiella pneumoniae]